MRKCFRNYYRLIKKSSVQRQNILSDNDENEYPNHHRGHFWTLAMGEAAERYERSRQKNPIDRGTFHPVIIEDECIKTRGTRNGKYGLYPLPNSPQEEGLHSGIELLINLSHHPCASVRWWNYDFHYTMKNWETTLIWIKQ